MIVTLLVVSSSIDLMHGGDTIVTACMSTLTLLTQYLVEYFVQSWICRCTMALLSSSHTHMGWVVSSIDPTNELGRSSTYSG